ncbi:MAG: hypothetical protein J5379_06225 [Clostridiales bacterium]|nr:hypothetical protein [Clostridiales bacterium]
MSFAKSKNDFSKKDMNFFSEFSSAASQQISSAFPIFLIATVAILVITLLVWIICGIQVMKTQDKINDLKATMASADYQARLAAKDQSQAEVEELKSYFYVLSSLDAKVSGKNTSAVETLTTVVSVLPDDTILTFYQDTDGTVDIQGQCLNRESAYNYLNLLKEKDIFSFIEEEIKAIDPVADLQYKKETLMFGTMQYNFAFTCTLKGHYTLSWASFIDGTVPTPLTNLRTQTFSAGSDFKLPDIATYSENGVNYTLTNIKVNGTAVSPEQLQEAINNNAYAGKVSSTMNIEFMYKVAEEGGES